MGEFQCPNMLFANSHHLLPSKIEFFFSILLNGPGFASFGQCLVQKTMEFTQECPSLTVRPGFGRAASQIHHYQQKLDNCQHIPSIPTNLSAAHSAFQALSLWNAQILGVHEQISTGKVLESGFLGMNHCIPMCLGNISLWRAPQGLFAAWVDPVFPKKPPENSGLVHLVQTRCF